MPTNFNFSVEADNAEDFKAQMDSAFSIFNLGPDFIWPEMGSSTTTANGLLQSFQAPKAQVDKVVEKKKRGRPFKKVEAPVVVKVPEEEEVTEAPVVTSTHNPVFNLDTVKKALMRVVAKYGNETEDSQGHLIGIEILRRFDCEKISELASENYGACIAKCEVALNGGAI